MVPFAFITDIESRWRQLSDAEKLRATALLSDASALIRAERPTIDSMVNGGTIDPDIPRMVAVTMVKRAMAGSADMIGIQSQQQTSGPFSQQYTFTNPSGDLYLTKAEKRLLLGRRRGRAFMVDTTQESE